MIILLAQVGSGVFREAERGNGDSYTREVSGYLSRRGNPLEKPYSAASLTGVANEKSCPGEDSHHAKVSPREGILDCGEEEAAASSNGTVPYSLPQRILRHVVGLRGGVRRHGGRGG